MTSRELGTQHAAPTSRRFVEITGIGFPNKGAELMLRAVIAQMEHAHGLLPVTEARRDYHHRRRHDLYQRIPDWAGPIPIGLAAPLVPRFLRDRLGIVLDSQLAAVLDCSGFAYGDYWGPRKIERLDRERSRCRRNSIPLILLPQAFGPFETPGIKDRMRRALQGVSLVFARDPVSLAHLRDLGTNAEVHLAPDFTGSATPILLSEFVRFHGRPCLVPNEKMIAGSSTRARAEHAAAWGRLVDGLRSLGMDPFLLLHEPMQDKALSNEILLACSAPVEVVQHEDPRVLKGLLGQAPFVVSSRYHACIGALSQAVPAWTMGWSHKYKALLEEFDCAKLMVDVDRGNFDAEQILAKCGDKVDFLQPVSARLELAARTQSTRVATMWSLVAGMLSQNDPGE